VYVHSPVAAVHVPAAAKTRDVEPFTHAAGGGELQIFGSPAHCPAAEQTSRSVQAF
jgi:hypothetical protein